MTPTLFSTMIMHLQALQKQASMHTHNINYYRGTIFRHQSKKSDLKNQSMIIIALTINQDFGASFPICPSLLSFFCTHIHTCVQTSTADSC